MKTEAYISMFGLISGILLVGYALLAALRIAPVFSLIKPKTEKEKRKEIRFHVISYGGMGLIGIMHAIWFFADVSWAYSMEASIRTVLTVYLLWALTFRVYIRGYIPGDSFDS